LREAPRTCAGPYLWKWPDERVFIPPGIDTWRDEAAALSALGNVEPRNLDVPALQRKLIEQGAELRRQS